MDFGLKSLAAAACKTFREPKPHECSHLNGSSANNAATFVILSATAAFIAVWKLI